MNVGIIVLARMGSSRLPGKVMLDLCGKPILEHIVCRLKKVKRANDLVVASTINKGDNVIAEFCERMGVCIFRGNEENVLNRCIKASEANNLDIIVRVGADAPFIDWEVIDSMLDLFLCEYEKGNRLEYMSNSLRRSFPLGLDADIMTRETLIRVDEETRILSEEERRTNEINVIPYIHRNLDKFNALSFHKDFDLSHLRWTLDTPEDYEFTQKVYDALYPVNPNFLMKDVMDLLKKNPDWPLINSKVVPRSGYWTKVEAEKLRLSHGVTLE